MKPDKLTVNRFGRKSSRPPGLILPKGKKASAVPKHCGYIMGWIMGLEPTIFRATI